MRTANVSVGQMFFYTIQFFLPRSMLCLADWTIGHQYCANSTKNGWNRQSMPSWSPGARKSHAGCALGAVQSPLWDKRNDETRLWRSCFCRMALSSRKTHQSCLITADYELGGDVLKRAKQWRFRYLAAPRDNQATAARPVGCCCAGRS